MYMRNNKGPNIKPCGKQYLIVWISDLFTQIAFEPIKSYSSDAIMVEFGKKDIMNDSVKGFLQVYEDTRGKFFIVKNISYHFCEDDKSMTS